MPFASDTLELAHEPELNPFATLAALAGKEKNGLYSVSTTDNCEYYSQSQSNAVGPQPASNACNTTLAPVASQGIQRPCKKLQARETKRVYPGTCFRAP